MENYDIKKIFRNIILAISIFHLSLYLILKNFKKEKFTSESEHSHDNSSDSKDKKGSNICRGYLTDREYLKHMIPHHQVAVDISYLLQKITKSPEMLEILRKLIWTQETEIKLMNIILKSMDSQNGTISPIRISDPTLKMSKSYRSTLGDFTEPNKLELTQTYCDPHFFDPESHMKHMENMKLDDKMYIEHMIPHHQVAVDMSKVLIKNTENDYMVFLAYRIIRSQQSEIILLDQFLNKSLYKHEILI